MMPPTMFLPPPSCGLPLEEMDVRAASLRRLPTVTFDVDGVLANFIQGMFDLLTPLTLKFCDWHDCTHWDTVQSGLLTPEECEKAWRLVLNEPYFWATIEPFEDVDFQTLNTHMEVGEFVGYFVTSRFDLDTPNYVGDARFLTQCWLQKQGLKAHAGVVVQRNQSRADLLYGLGSDYHLDDIGDNYLSLCAAGIQAYLLDRPWNRYLGTSDRVCSIEEFLNRTVFKLRQEDVACL